MNRHLFLVLLLFPARAHAQCASESFRPEAESALLLQLNEERRRAGIPELTLDPQLTAAARGHSACMADRNSLVHRTEGEPALNDRLENAGAVFTFAAENVAVVTHLAEAHPGLMGSPGHRANILKPEYDRVGIGVVFAREKYWVTQNFIRRLVVVPLANAEQQLEALINAAKPARGSIKLLPSARLRDTACRQAQNRRANAADVRPETGTRAIAVFSMLDLAALPDSVRRVVKNVDRSAYVGTCLVERASDTKGYWFVLSY